MRFLPSLFLVALMVVPVVGCTTSTRVGEGTVVWSESTLREHLQQLTRPAPIADSARVAGQTQYAARRMRAAGLMPARDPSFLVRMGPPVPQATRQLSPNPARAHVLGYVAGRHPSYYDELVLVAADLDSPGAAAVLETARVLAEEALTTQVPERTVLFALWAPPRTGALGLEDYLANPTWALDDVHRVLLVTADTAAATASRRLLDARGIASEVVTVADQSVAAAGVRAEVERARALVRTARLTEALYARIRAAAAHLPSE